MPTGLLSTYDLTVGVKVNMDESIYVLSPIDSPMISGLDSDGLSVIGSAPVDEVAFSWMTESLLIPRATASATTAVVTAATEVILSAVADRLKFSTGDLIRLVKPGATAPEIMRVTGYSATSTNTILVSRSYDGTTAVEYTTGVTIIGLGTALAEGSDPEAARATDRVEASNVTQIFGPTAVHLSATEQIVNKYGVANEFTRQVYNRMKENVVSREQAYLYGRKATSSTTEIRSTGGLDYYITTNVDTASTQLTVAKIQALQQLGYNAGGVFDRIAANPVSLGDLNEIADTSRVRQEFVDSRRGRQPVMSVYTEFGPITMVRNRWVHPTTAFGFSREGVTRRILRPLVLERLAKTGDSDKAQIVCEEGLEVKGQEHFGKFVGLLYS